MSNEELVELIQEDMNRNENLTQLYNQNKGFLVKMARKYAGLEDMEDLLQVAYCGLHRAIAGYNPEHGSFIGYAGFYIKAELKHYIENSGRGPKVGSGRIGWLVALRRKRQELTALLNREPTDEELRKALEMPVEAFEYTLAMDYQTDVTSLDAPRSGGDDGGEVTLGDIIPSSLRFEDEVQEALDAEALKRDVSECLEKLPEKQRHVLDSYYFRMRTLEEISRELHMSKEGVRQARNKGLQRLREGLEGEALREKWHIENVSTKGLRGGYRVWYHTGASIVEELAISHVDKSAERAKMADEDD